MKRKTIFVALILSLCFMTIALFACQENGDKLAEKPSITLDTVSVSLDLHETVLLTATVLNSTQSVVWSTSAETVATVSGGLVTAVSEGTALIKATVEDAEAVCTVTVYNSGTAPVLILEDAEVSLQKGDTFTLNAGVKYKQQTVEGVVFAWEITGAASVISITPSDNTASAEIAGLKTGDTEVKVSATVYGVSLIDTIEISVVNAGVTFSVENLSATNGQYKKTLHLYQTGDFKSSFIPDVIVMDNQTTVTEGVDWRVDDNTIVSLNETTKEVTALKAGNTDIIVSFEGNELVINFTTERTPVAISGDYYVETRGGNTIEIDDELIGTVSSAKVVGFECFESFNASSSILTLNTSVLPTATASMGKDKTFVITTDKAIYSGTATLCSMTIYDTATLDGFMDVAKQLSSPSTTTATGYFVITADITYENAAGYTCPFPNQAALISGRGFNGVLDGQGHVIAGFKTQANAGSNGLIGSLAQNGVVRNIVFTDAVLQGGGSFIAWYNAGEIHDIYISGTQAADLGNASPNLSSAWLNSRGSTVNSIVKNVIIDIKEKTSGAGSGSAFGRNPCIVAPATDNLSDWPVLINLWAIGNITNRFGHAADNPHPSTTCAIYSTYADMVSADNDYSGFTHPMWAVTTGGIPYPAALADVLTPTPAMSSSTDDTVDIGQTLTLTAISPRYTGFMLSSAALADGLTISGNVITVPDNLELESNEYTVTMFNFYEPSKTATFTFTVTHTLIQNALSGDYYVETRGGNTVSIDNDIVGTVTSVKVGGIECFDSYDAVSRTLTLDTTGLPTATASMGKGKTFVIMTDKAVYSGTATLCTMAIYDTATFDDFMNVAKRLANPDAEDLSTVSTATGYFVVTADFTYTNANGYPSVFKYMVAGIAVGFGGTFDGQGHVITGLKTRATGTTTTNNALGANGIFGLIAGTGKVGNIVFAEAVLQGGNAFIAWGNAGLIHDIYISGTQTGGTAWFNSRGATKDSVVRNVIIDIVGGTTAGSAFGRNGWTGAGEITDPNEWPDLINVWAIGHTTRFGHTADNPHPSTTCAIYSTYADMVSADNDYSGFTHSMWALNADGIPYPVALLPLP